MNVKSFPIKRRTSTVLIGFIASVGIAAQSTIKLPLVAVMPLSGQNVDSASALIVSEVLSNELIKSGRVRVMERSQMEKILKEQGFQQSGSCDGSECAVEMGKLLSIDKMVVGTLGKLGGSYSVSLRAVDVGTGEVVGSSQKMQRGEIDEVAASLLPGVAKELAFSLNPIAMPLTDSVKPSVAPVTQSLAPVLAEKPAPVQAVAKEEPNTHWGWWIASGAVVAGGATAAVLLLSGKESSATPAPVSTTTSTDITAKWAN